jgi:hypothetical protein
MRKSLFLLTLVVAPTFAGTMKIDDFDQAKLAEIIATIPSKAQEQKITAVSDSVMGHKVSSIFPTSDGPLQIACESTYFNDSPYASSSGCKVTINHKHEDVQIVNDQMKITLRDPVAIKALHTAMPFAGEKKKVYSFHRDIGRTFEGVYSNVFHWIIDCESSTQCALYFSHISYHP